MKDSNDKNEQQLPDHEIETLARCFLPAIREYFESEEGQKEFKEWQNHWPETKQEQNPEKEKCIEQKEKM